MVFSLKTFGILFAEVGVIGTIASVSYYTITKTSPIESAKLHYSLIADKASETDKKLLDLIDLKNINNDDAKDKKNLSKILFNNLDSISKKIDELANSSDSTESTPDEDKSKIALVLSNDDETDSVEETTDKKKNEIVFLKEDLIELNNKKHEIFLKWKNYNDIFVNLFTWFRTQNQLNFNLVVDNVNTNESWHRKINTLGFVMNNEKNELSLNDVKREQNKEPQFMPLAQFTRHTLDNNYFVIPHSEIQPEDQVGDKGFFGSYVGFKMKFENMAIRNTQGDNYDSQTQNNTIKIGAYYSGEQNTLRYDADSFMNKLISSKKELDDAINNYNTYWNQVFQNSNDLSKSNESAAVDAQP